MYTRVLYGVRTLHCRRLKFGWELIPIPTDGAYIMRRSGTININSFRPLCSLPSPLHTTVPRARVQQPRMLYRALHVGLLCASLQPRAGRPGIHTTVPGAVSRRELLCLAGLPPGAERSQMRCFTCCVDLDGHAAEDGGRAMSGCRWRG